MAAPKPMPTARTSVTTMVSAVLRARVAMRSGVRVQGFVQRDARAGSGADLKSAGDAVAPELQTGLPGHVGCLDRAAVGSGELRACGDVGACLDDAVVA